MDYLATFVIGTLLGIWLSAEAGEPTDEPEVGNEIDWRKVFRTGAKE